MAYQTSSVSSFSQLLSELSVFAVANGWTQDNLSATQLSLSRSGSFFHLRDSGSGTLRASGASGYTPSALEDAHPGASRSLYGDDYTFPATYHFFQNGSYVHCVLDIGSGVYKYICFGDMTPIGTYTGGQYMHLSMTATTQQHDPFGNYHGYPFEGRWRGAFNPGQIGAPSAIRADIDGQTDFWFEDGFYENTSGSLTTVLKFTQPNGYRGFYNIQADASPNSFNAATILHRIPALVTRDNGLVSPIGAYEDVRWVDITNLDPGEVLTIGSDDWYTFPLYNKILNAPSGTASSGSLGIAFLRVN